MNDRELLQQQLRTGVLDVTFTKLNGEQRVMTCTLIPALIPEEARPKGVAVLSEEAQERTMRVYDLNAKGWRSFVPSFRRKTCVGRSLEARAKMDFPSWAQPMKVSPSLNKKSMPSSSFRTIASSLSQVKKLASARHSPCATTY